MSTRPINRSRSRPVSPELAMKFARYVELAPIRWDCIRMVSCRRTEPGVACPECAENRELMVELVQHFKLPPVLLRDDFDPPPEEMSEADKLSYWQDCLEEAVREARSQ